MSIRPIVWPQHEAELGNPKSEGNEEFHIPVSWGLEVVETLGTTVFNDSKTKYVLMGGTEAYQFLFRGPTRSHHPFPDPPPPESSDDIETCVVMNCGLWTA